MTAVIKRRPERTRGPYRAGFLRVYKAGNYKATPIDLGTPKTVYKATPAENCVTL